LSYRIPDPVAYHADILLGRIVKAQGFDGSVSVKLERGFTEEIPDMESVFLEIEGKPVPFFIEESERSGADNLRLKFSKYNSQSVISGFTGCRVYLTRPPEHKSGKSSQSFKGYKVYDGAGKFTATVRDIVNNPGQILLLVDTAEGKEILIPFHEDLIRNIDRKKREICMDLPEGIAEIN